MDIAIFSHAKDCGMEEAMAAFGEKENHCCDDESFTFQGQEDLKLSWDELDVETQQFLISFAASYFQLFAIPSGQEVPKITYPPPLPVRDFTVLYEVFLIWCLPFQKCRMCP